MSNVEQISLSIHCNCICQREDFKERFKVVKAIGHGITQYVRRFYKYCPICALYIKTVKDRLCSCCKVTLRKSRRDAISRGKRYYRNNKEKAKLSNLKWLRNNHEKYKQYQRENYLKNREHRLISNREYRIRRRLALHS